MFKGFAGDGAALGDLISLIFHNRKSDRSILTRQNAEHATQSSENTMST